MMGSFIRRLLGRGPLDVAVDVHAALQAAFPALDARAVAHLVRVGHLRSVRRDQLISDMDDPAPRVVLLIEGMVTIERPYTEDIEVSPGVAWNELTWASRGRVRGGRLHAGADGAVLLEWKEKCLRSLAIYHQTRYAALMDAVMRSASLHHTLQLEKARGLPNSSVQQEVSVRPSNGAALAARTAA